MSGDYTKLSRSIWDNPDFAALTPESKLLYMYLISSKKLTACGVLDLMPGRWAGKLGLTRERLELAIRELSETRFVVIDLDTDELLVRTFVRHGVTLTSWQMCKAMWKAVERIDSTKLRDALALALPPEAWTNEKVEPFLEQPKHSESDDLSDDLSDGASDTPVLSSSLSVPALDLKPENTETTRIVQGGFDAFWERYPRKAGKGDARKAFGRALRRAGSDVVVLEGLVRLLPAWARGDPQFIPHPATWLNRDGWEDDPPPPPTERRTATQDRNERNRAATEHVASMFSDRKALPE